MSPPARGFFHTCVSELFQTRKPGTRAGSWLMAMIYIIVQSGASSSSKTASKLTSLFKTSSDFHAVMLRTSVEMIIGTFQNALQADTNNADW